jgi:UDP-glucose 4-epimerase
MARLLVTGGTGFIGARLLTLAHDQHDLHVITHQRQPVYGTSHAADLSDPGAVTAVVRHVQPDVILHLAAAGVARGKTDLRHLLTVNVLGLQALLEAAASLETPPHVVIAGSWFEYASLTDQRPLQENDPLSAALPYSVSKMAAATVAEHYASRLPITILRVFSVYGVGEPLPRLAPYIIDQTMKGESVDLTDCEQVRDYVYVDDIAEGFLRTAAIPPIDGSLRVLNLGTGNGVRLRDFVEQIGERMTERGYSPQFNFGARPYRANETMYAVADTTRLQSRLDWTPHTSLSDGIEKTIAAQLAQ